MRKFWMVLAVGLLVGAVAAPALAIEFQFKGAFRWRLYDLEGANTIDNLTPNYKPAPNGLSFGNGMSAQSPFIKGQTATGTRSGWQGDLRFRPYIIASDDNGAVQSHLRFEIGDVMWGDTFRGSAGRSAGGTTGADGVNVETKWAFIDIQLPGGIPLRMRGGIQPWLLPKSAILDDDIAGLKFYGASGMVSYEAGWMAINQRENGRTQAVVLQNPPPGNTAQTAGPSNDDINAWYGKVDFAISKMINPYIYGVYKHGSAFQTTNQSSSSDGYWLGVGATGALGIVKYDFDFIYMQDDPHLVQNRASSESRNMKTQGWFIDGGIEAPIGPVAVGLRGMYATGDKTDTNDKVETFGGVMDSSNTTCLGGYTSNGMNELWWNSNGSTYFSWGADECPGNSWTIGLYAIYRPVKALKLKLDWFYIGAAKADSNVWTGKSSIGNEIAFVAEYTVATGTRLYAMAGVLIAPNQGRANNGTSVDLKDATALAVGVFHDF